ncbi:MAG: hypothetical protein A2140_09675 [Candidatus Muproteobacteria bacterium RBG_16_62_13]|uniref:CARDB domain-containing protein n=1 Tax=Candidatus Muproteobacteria bacterium RBG_16_62_13 TaxID=1817756 RepID=A0A1F6T0N6_9PROT|nr:MAG: hypothetical protein A2140_09675 [Candidatus Muproteobacteria bacterium RBG_16_62_13]
MTMEKAAMRQARTFGWLRFFHAAALCVLAAPALAAPRDDVNLINLSPPSGTLPGVRSSGEMGPVNSVEATINYRLQSTSTPQGFITISGEPPTTYPITMSPLPPTHFSNGRGEVRVRFSWLCNDRSPLSNPLPAVIYRMIGVDATGRATGVLVQKTQAVNFTFTCRPPLQIKRPSDAALTTPGESPMQQLNPQAQGSLRPDLVPVLTQPMSATVIVRNIGAGPAPTSTLFLNCFKSSPTFKHSSDGCPTTVFTQSGGVIRIALIEIPSLAPGAEHVVNLKPWPSTWPSGEYIFQAKADYRLRVSERDETNNSAQSEIVVR